MTYSGLDHSMFYWHFAPNLYVYLMVYVDNIVLTAMVKMVSLSWNNLFQYFKQKYFLGIEVAQYRSSIVIPQHKYALDILRRQEWGCRTIDTHMNSSLKLLLG